MYLNRTACDVLHEMRAMLKSLSFGSLLGSIEELQCMVNRMEGKLTSYNDIADLDERWSAAKKKDKALMYMRAHGFLEDADN